ncbi:MAG: hypothetical protein EOM41_06725 [Bacilli bacterium]|nr:hypothetical protein [Bacilli bacterium]
MRRKDTIEMRAYVETTAVLLIEELSKRRKKPKGEIIIELLADSPKWQELLKKFEQFSETL